MIRNILFCLFCLWLPVSASELQQLIDDNKLEVKLKLANADAVFARQAFNLELEVATDGWFNKGTQLELPQVNGLVLKQLNKFAINGNRRVKGQTWASQTRELTVYAIEPGDFTIPAMRVNVSVNSPGLGVVEGVLTTNTIKLEVKQRPELNGFEHYVVSPSYKLNVSISDKSQFNIGDALTLDIDFAAEDVPAMMLPQYQTEPISGTAIYSAPIKLKDHLNRGFLTGKVHQRITYIMQEAGDYRLPEQNFIWWNSQSNSLEQLVVPEFKWQVIAAQTSTPEGANKNSKTGSIFDLKHTLRGLLLLVLVVLSISILWHMTRNWRQHRAKVKRVKMAYLDAVAGCNYQLAVTKLYEFYKYQGLVFQISNLEVSKQKVLNKLFALAYRNGQGEDKFTNKEANELLKKTVSRGGVKQAVITDKVKLN